MNKHTPGPWSVERDRAKSLSLYAGTTFIGEVYHDKDEPSTEEQGNVNLIAAAPAMYEALKDAIACIEQTLSRKEIHERRDRIIAALAQAEGKL